MFSTGEIAIHIQTCNDDGYLSTRLSVSIDEEGVLVSEDTENIRYR